MLLYSIYDWFFVGAPCLFLFIPQGVDVNILDRFFEYHCEWPLGMFKATILKKSPMFSCEFSEYFGKNYFEHLWMVTSGW